MSDAEEGETFPEEVGVCVCVGGGGGGSVCNIIRLF